MTPLAACIRFSGKISLLFLFVLFSFQASASHALEGLGSALFILFWIVIIFSLVSLSTSILRLFHINKFLGIVSSICGIIVLIASVFSCHMLGYNPIPTLAASLIWMLIIHKKRTTDTYRNSLNFRVIFTTILLVSSTTVVTYLMFLNEMEYYQFILLSFLTYFLVSLVCLFHFNMKDLKNEKLQTVWYWLMLILRTVGIFVLFRFVLGMTMSFQIQSGSVFQGLTNPFIIRETLLTAVMVGFSGVLAVLALRLTRKVS